MSAHHHTSQKSSGSFWNIANIVIAVVVGGFALYWGAALFLGGVAQISHDKSKVEAPPAEESAAAPTEPTAAAAPAPAAAPAAPAPAATPAAAAAPAPAAPAPAAPAASGDVAEITIKPDVANPLAFDLKQFTVKAGQKVKLTFNNTHPAVPQPHNICIGKPETKDKLLAAAMGMAAAPDGMAKGFIPDSPDVLFHTKLLQPNMVEVLEFTAPAAGAYPYICTFPGHGILMNGVMNVE